jgi:hypothetical protein
MATNFSLNNSNVVFYWVDGASNRTVQVSATVDGKTVTGQAVFNIYRPSVTFTDEPPSWATNDVIDGTLSLVLGNAGGSGSMSYRIDVSSAYSGKTDFTQLINRSAANGDTSDSTSGQFWMDNTRFYLSQATNDSVFTVSTNHVRPLLFNDGPSFALAHSLIGGNITSIFDQFKDYVRFKPSTVTDTNIWITLGTNGWSMDGEACLVTGMSGTNLPPASTPINTDEFPEWTGVRHE